MRAAGDEVLLIICSDHGHETVRDVVDIEAELIAAGLKEGADSTDVLSLANGTSALIYVDPARDYPRARLDAFLRRQDWAGRVFGGAELGQVGQAAANGLAFAVAMAADDGPNAFGVPGRSFAAKPRWDKADRLGCGQHGGLGRYEQSPVLMIAGGGFGVGARNQGSAHITDLAPTIMRHLGLPAPDMDGRPLRPGG